MCLGVLVCVCLGVGVCVCVCVWALVCEGRDITLDVTAGLAVIVIHV